MPGTISIAALLILATTLDLRAEGKPDSRTMNVDMPGPDGPRLAINANAPAFAATQLEIGASPAAVWAVLTNFDEWTTWMPEIASAQLQGPLAAGSVIYWEPFEQNVASRIVAIEPERKLIWNGTDGAVHIWELIPVANGTLLRNSESIETWKAVDSTQNQSAVLFQLLTAWNRRLAAQTVQRDTKADTDATR
jgi:uncharacterized protein YndB with AHSA1/START domain